MSKKILIVGDSWGCGEWSYLDNTYKTIHKGLEYFLSREHIVKNLSIPAGANIKAVDFINRYHKEYDTILWIVTEPSRDFGRFNYFFKKKEDIFLSVNIDIPFIEQCKTALRCQVEEVQMLCGAKVIVIGGLHKLQKEYFVSAFKKIINWIDILEGSHIETYYINSAIYEEEYFINIKKNQNDEKKRRIFFNYLLEKKEFFYPDGIHPNRKSHEMLYKNIKEYI